MESKKTEKKKKDKKKKKKANAMDAFKASIMAQKEEQEKKTFDMDEVLAVTTDSSTESGGKHARTTTETILAQLSALNDDDLKSSLMSDTDAVEHDDNAEIAFLQNLNDYLGNDFVSHKRSWSSISTSSTTSGGHHGRSGTLFSLSHNRSRKESMQLMLNIAKSEQQVHVKESKLFSLIFLENSRDIEKLEQYLKNDIDLNLLWSFLDLILFCFIKYYREKDDKIGIKDLYFVMFKLLNSNSNRFFKNSCFRQYIKFLSVSNSGNDIANNPISSLMSYLLLFESSDPDNSDSNYDFKKDKLIITWEYIANKGYKTMDEIDVDSNDFDFYDPIRCDFDFKNCFIKKIYIRKVFNSANRPLLMDILCSDDTRTSVILKKGDDLRKDKALMNIFKFMNYIWFRENKDKDSAFYNTLNYRKILVKILTFNVVSISDKMGIIELVTNCIPLRHIDQYMDELIEEHKQNLLSSAAASYIASYICGVKDRHFDNILFRTTDATLFHIDFGYCLGESIKNPFAIDTSIFAITQEFYNIIGEEDYEQHFVPLCVSAYLALRKHYKQLIDFALLSFSFLFKEKNEKKMKEFLMKKLKVKEKDEKKIKEWLTNEIKKAPFSKKTKLKNKLHRINSPTMTEEELDAKTPK